MIVPANDEVNTVLVLRVAVRDGPQLLCKFDVLESAPPRPNAH